MARKTTKKCDTPDCNDPAICAGLCTPCYSWSYYHKKQGVAANQLYKKRQRRTASRIERHMSSHRPVKSIGRGKPSETRAYH